MRAPGTFLAATILLGFVTQRTAWTAATRVVMIDDAIKLMPPSLRSVLEHRRNDVRRGMLEPMTQEDTPAHRPPVGRREPRRPPSMAPPAISFRARRPACRSTTSLAASACSRISSRTPDSPRRPPGAPGASRYAHFAGFCETRRSRFPLVFYGHDNAALAKSDFKSFTADVLDRARAEDANLARLYAEASDLERSRRVRRPLGPLRDRLAVLLARRDGHRPGLARGVAAVSWRSGWNAVRRSRSDGLPRPPRLDQRLRQGRHRGPRARASPRWASRSSRPAARRSSSTKPGLPVVSVADQTGFPEMLDGRVKTLHPRSTPGSSRSATTRKHMADLEAAGIAPIDLVVVNLYPFARTAADPAKSLSSRSSR